jgi:hypothetical protein
VVDISTEIGHYAHVMPRRTSCAAALAGLALGACSSSINSSSSSDSKARVTEGTPVSSQQKADCTVEYAQARTQELLATFEAADISQIEQLVEAPSRGDGLELSPTLTSFLAGLGPMPFS